MPEHVSPHTDTPLLEALAQANTQPLWDRYMRMLTIEPKSPDEAMLWAWEAMQPLIDRARREVPMEHAERRVLLLANPAFAPQPYTTTNLQAGLQILQPGDHAAPHRHTVAALRFVMQGSGTVTRVDGKDCPMEPGDLILTPAWCWHEHRNDGQSPMVWFDGLDMPFVHSLSAAFLQFGPPGETPEQFDDAVAQAGMAPVAPPPAYQDYSPRYRYDAASVRAALASLAPAADGSRLLRYTNPATGGPVTPTLDCYALALQQGAQTRAYRSTSNAIVVVAGGEGVSTVGEREFAWKANDVFTLPHWKWISHRAASPDAQLFLMSDQGLLQKIGYLRTEWET